VSDGAGDLWDKEVCKTDPNPEGCPAMSVRRPVVEALLGNLSIEQRLRRPYIYSAKASSRSTS
jgi:hypothetical protein